MSLLRLPAIFIIANLLSVVSFSAMALDKSDEIKKLNTATNSYIKKHDYKQALENSDKVLKLDPNNITALNKRIVIYMLTKQKDKATPDFDKLISLAQTPALKHAATAYKDSYFDKFTEAKDEMDQAIKLEPTNAAFYADRADIQIKLKHDDLALADANKALELDPKFFGGYFARARIYKALGKHQEAKEDFAMAEKLKAAQVKN